MSAIKPNAIILGGTHDHIHLINLLKAEGFFTILIDYYNEPIAAGHADKHIRSSAADFDAVLTIAKEKNAQLVLSLCIDSTLKTAIEVSNSLGLFHHIPLDLAFILADKQLLKEKFAEFGIPSPAFGKLEKPEQFNGQIPFPMVIKPVDSSSSKGIKKVNTSNELDAAFAYAKSFGSTGNIIYEEFVEGPEYTIDAVTIGGKTHIVMISEIIKSSGNPEVFTIVKNSFSPEIHNKLLPEVSVIAQTIAEKLEIKNSPMLIQAIKTNSGLKVLEFSTRTGGGSKYQFIQLNTGFDIVKWSLDLYLGIQNISTPQIISEHSEVIYLYCRDGQITEYAGFHDLVSSGIIENYFLYKPRGAVISGALHSGDRAAGVIIKGKDSAELTSKRKKIVDSIGILDNLGQNIALHT